MGEVPCRPRRLGGLLELARGIRPVCGSVVGRLEVDRAAPALEAGDLAGIAVGEGQAKDSDLLLDVVAHVVEDPVECGSRGVGEPCGEGCVYAVDVATGPILDEVGLVNLLAPVLDHP